MSEATWKLYSPLRAEFFPKSENGEINQQNQNAIQFTGTDLTAYEDSVCEAVDRYLGWDDDLAGYIRDDCGIDYGVQINRKVLSAVPSVESVNGELVGCTTVRLSEPLDEAETDALCDYLTGQYADGWGEGFEQQEIKVEDGVLYVSFWNSDHFAIEIDRNPAAGQEKTAEQAAPSPERPKMGENKKYEITDNAHPQFPWLHRIRALRDVGIGGQVKAGTLGGFVQSEDNLSQQGDCWLFNDAIACESALVSKNAQVSGCAVIRGSSLVSGQSRVTGQAVVEDNAIVMDGYIEANAHISGNARVGANQTTHQAPWIKQDAAVFGEVFGNVIVCEEAIVLPGAKIDLSTTDLLYIQTYRVEMARDVDRAKSNLKQPAGFVTPTEKPKHHPPER